MRRRSRAGARIAAVLLVLLLCGRAAGQSPSVAVETPEVLAARTLGAWVTRLLARPKRLLGLAPEVQGVLVDGVVAGGPAGQGGLRKGDVVSAVDGLPVATLCAFGTRLREARPGAEVTLLVRRMSGSALVKVTPSASAAEVTAAACERGDALGCFLAGLGVRDSSERGAAASVRFFEKSCNEGFADGCSALGEAHRDGRGVPRDDKEAVRFFHRACENDSSSGCTSEAFQYATGTGVRRDDAWATPIFERACDRGSASGCYNVGLMYEKGRGVSADLARARAGYEQGCEGGDFLACTNLGYLHEKGLGVPVDDVRAAVHYARGCEGDPCLPGDPTACSNLAIFHRRGRGGLAKDETKAVALFRKACDHGRAPACGELGAMLGNGEGAPRDDAAAARLYEKACHGNYALGCANLASALAHGLGVAKDPGRAAVIFRRLCDAGDEISCRDLAPLERKSGGTAW